MYYCKESVFCSWQTFTAVKIYYTLAVKYKDLKMKVS